MRAWEWESDRERGERVRTCTCVCTCGVVFPIFPSSLIVSSSVCLAGGRQQGSPQPQLFLLHSFRVYASRRAPPLPVAALLGSAECWTLLNQREFEQQIQRGRRTTKVKYKIYLLCIYTRIAEICDRPIISRYLWLYMINDKQDNGREKEIVKWCT